MTQAAEKYLSLENALWDARRMGKPMSIEEEGRILMEMSDHWMEMTEEEIAEADARALRLNQEVYGVRGTP